MQESKSATKDHTFGMTVDEVSALHAERDGKVFYFCSDHCRQKSLSAPAAAMPEVKSRGGFLPATRRLASHHVPPEIMARDSIFCGVIIERWRVGPAKKGKMERRSTFAATTAGRSSCPRPLDRSPKQSRAAAVDNVHAHAPGVRSEK